MERYTVRQVNRALAQEQLLKRLDTGEGFEELCKELGLSHSRDYLPELRRRYCQGGSTWEVLIDRRHGHSYKVTPERRSWLRQQKQENPALTQQQLAELFEAEFQVTISQSQISNILRAEGVAIPGGQRYRASAEQALPVERAGVFFPSGSRAPDGGAEHRDSSHVGAEEDLSGV
jgi:beta-lactamase class A